MNNELIERIDEWIATHFSNTQDTAILIIDCKAEIERLLLTNESLKGLCQDYAGQIKQLEKAREYVPMSDDDKRKYIDTAQGNGSANNWNMLDKLIYLIDSVEYRVIKHAGLVVKEKE